jgi:hypothetical protein
MTRLSERIAKLELGRGEAGPGLIDLCQIDLETCAAMAQAYGDALTCAAPDPWPFLSALLERMAASQAAGLGLRALSIADLSALVAAGDRLRA